MKKIALSQGKFALVDDADFDWLNQRKWCVNAQGYAVNVVYAGGGRSRTRNIITRMHRVILGATVGDLVDHANGNKLDNRRSNIRLCTKSQNGFNRGKTRLNRSGYKGVSLHDPGLSKPWRARIKAGDLYIHLGFFDSKESAAEAYEVAAKKYHGEYART